MRFAFNPFAGFSNLFTHHSGRHILSGQRLFTALLSMAILLAITMVAPSASFAATNFLPKQDFGTGANPRGIAVSDLNMPAFQEFERDTQAVQRGVVIGEPGAEQILSNNRGAFLRDFVTRAEFIDLYPATDTPAQYVDQLLRHAGIVPSAVERATAIAEFGGAATASNNDARGRALVDLVQNQTFQERQRNPSFVQMQYFGYLRRNPNDSPDRDFSGFDFWVGKLDQFGGNFVDAEMVKSFLVSFEYRQRFGPCRRRWLV